MSGCHASHVMSMSDSASVKLQGPLPKTEMNNRWRHWRLRYDVFNKGKVTSLVHAVWYYKKRHCKKWADNLQTFSWLRNVPAFFAEINLSLAFNEGMEFYFMLAIDAKGWFEKKWTGFMQILKFYEFYQKARHLENILSLTFWQF